jgi:predicted enzyme related to lactoylglutathione lyase
MITGYEGTCLYVRNQDDALDFYVHKLGFEKRADMQSDSGLRWVTVSPPGGQGIEITLYQPGDYDGEQEYHRLMNLIGHHPRWAFTTDDCQKTYEELSQRGVQFISPPIDMSYAIEALIVDLYGNILVLHERRK